MKFIIFHGSFGNPESNWYPSLKRSLDSLGQTVFTPAFPVDTWDELTQTGPKSVTQQNLPSWLSAFESISPLIPTGEPLCFVGHSIGCLMILHLVAKYGFKLDSAIFVSPFLRKLNKSWQIDAVNSTFYKTDFDFKKLKELIPVSYALYGDNDPYVEMKYALEFVKKMQSLPILIKGAGHMNAEVKLFNFPLVFELCKTRLNQSNT